MNPDADHEQHSALAVELVPEGQLSFEHNDELIFDPGQKLVDERHVLLANPVYLFQIQHTALKSNIFICVCQSTVDKKRLIEFLLYNERRLGVNGQLFHVVVIGEVDSTVSYKFQAKLDRKMFIGVEQVQALGSGCMQPKCHKHRDEEERKRQKIVFRLKARQIPLLQPKFLRGLEPGKPLVEPESINRLLFSITKAADIQLEIGDSGTLTVLLKAALSKFAKIDCTAKQDGKYHLVFELGKKENEAAVKIEKSISFLSMDTEDAEDVGEKILGEVEKIKGSAMETSKIDHLLWSRDKEDQLAMYEC